MKRIISIILTIAMLFSFAACGNQDAATDNKKSSSNIISSDGESLLLSKYEESDWIELDTSLEGLEYLDEEFLSNPYDPGLIDENNKDLWGLM